MPENKKPAIIEFIIEKYYEIVTLHLYYDRERDWSKMECCIQRKRDMIEILNFAGWEINE